MEKLIVCPECTVPLKPGEPTYGALEEVNVVMLEALKEAEIFLEPAIGVRNSPSELAAYKTVTEAIAKAESIKQ